MTEGNPHLSEFAYWLLMWAPTVWYVTAFIALWCGSGAFVFRSIMRARHSRGWQRIADEPETSGAVPSAQRFRHEDRTVWVFPSARLLVAAAVLGPIGAALLASIWPYVRQFFRTRAKIEQANARQRAEQVRDG